MRLPTVALAGTLVHAVRIGELPLRYLCRCSRLCRRSGHRCGHSSSAAGCSALQGIPHRLDQTSRTIGRTGDRIHIGALQSDDVVQQHLGVVDVGTVVTGAEHHNVRDLSAAHSDLHRQRPAKARTASGIHAVRIRCRLLHRFHSRRFTGAVRLCRRCSQRGQCRIRCTASASLLQRIPHGGDQSHRTVRRTGNRVHVGALHCNNVLQQRLGVVNIGAVIAGAEDGDLGNLPALNDHLHSNRAGKASSRSGIGAVLIGRLLRNRCHRRDFLFCRRCCRRVLLF